MKQWLFDFLSTATEDEATIFTITVWHVWEARNSVCNGEKQFHPKKIEEKLMYKWLCCTYLNHRHHICVSLIVPFQSGLRRRMGG
jgi:hypothetical protein